VVFLVSYLIGSIPTAYIAVRIKARIDIRLAGSGNVGTMNAYEVTGSRLLGIAVLVVDVAKGAVAALLGEWLGHGSVMVFGTSLFGVVCGHCFPVWLKFKGGRGLATTAGGMLVGAWPIVVVWLALWGMGYLIMKNIHAGNAFAIVATPLLAWSLPHKFLALLLPGAFSSSELLVAYTIVSVVLLFRHTKPLMELIHSSSNAER